MQDIHYLQRQITLRTMGYHFSCRLTATLNLCPIYLKLLVHVLQCGQCSWDFQVNQTKNEGGCQSGRKLVPHDSKSDLPLVRFSTISYEKILNVRTAQIVSRQIRNAYLETKVMRNTCEVLVIFQKSLVELQNYF